MKRKLMTMVAATVAATCLTGVFGQIAQAVPLKDVAPAPLVETKGAFPDIVCRPGYFQQGPRLCMTAYRRGFTAATASQIPATIQTFQNAEIDCQDIKGRVSDYNDWRYRFFRGDGALVFTAGVGTWLGPRTADDTALFANGQAGGNGQNFDGETSVFTSRFYTCSHDDTL